MSDLPPIADIRIVSDYVRRKSLATWRYSPQSAVILAAEKHDLDQRRGAVVMDDISVFEYWCWKRG
jgi:hypothetical protein